MSHSQNAQSRMRIRKIAIIQIPIIQFPIMEISIMEIAMLRIDVTRSDSCRLRAKAENPRVWSNNETESFAFENLLLRELGQQDGGGRL